MLVIAEVVGDLALECGLQQPLRQLRQHPALAGQRQPASLRAAHQLRHELLVQAIQPGLGLRVLSVLHAGHHVGHQVHFHDREIHRSFSPDERTGCPCETIGEPACSADVLMCHRESAA
ncbi:hypothetical protein DV26_35840 [Amycolatopsis mediterranei]|nr:hypothetical protein DV26_35840 [Amycolatopsis mediterranei]